MLIESKTFLAKKDPLSVILAWIYAQIEASTFSDAEQKRIQLAIEEAIVNILSYAPSENSLRLTIVFRYLPDQQIEIELRDDGIPFNPLTYSVVDQSSRSLDEREPGGCGVMLIKRCMDAVTYHFEDGHNVLTLIKNFSKSD